MRTELYSVRSSAEEISFLNKNLRKIVTTLNEETSIRVLYKTEIDYNPRKIKADLIESLSADNPPEFYIYVNALDSEDNSSFRYLFSPIIERLEKELPQEEVAEDGKTPLYPHIKVYPLESLPGSYPAYCFTFKNKKFLVLPRISLVGGDLLGYMSDAVNCAKEIFDKAFSECPDGYILSTQKPAKKSFLATFFAKKPKETPKDALEEEATHSQVTLLQSDNEIDSVVIPADESAVQRAELAKSNEDGEIVVSKEKEAGSSEDTKDGEKDVTDKTEVTATDKESESADSTEETGDSNDSQEDSAEKPKQGKFKKFLNSIFPMKGDSTKTLVSKWVVIIFAIVFLVGAGMLVNFFLVDPMENQSVMKEIQDIFYETQPQQTDAQGNVIITTADEKPLKNWEGLKKINKEIVGWIKLDKTEIDYPVLFHEGDTAESPFYLYKNYKKEYSDFGSIFLDFRCTEGVNSRHVILHGHNMGTDNSMFGSLIQYARAGGWVQGNTKFYKSAPVVKFDTPELDAEWVVFAVMKIDVSNEDKAIFNYLLGDFSSDAQYMNFIYNIKERSYLDVPVPINENDRLLTLSTCSYETDNMRTVVVARMVREGEDVSKYVSKVSKVTPASTVTSTFGSEYESGNIKWYDGEGKLEGNENLEFMEQAEMFVVKFVDAKGKTIASQQVLKGKDATAPTGEAPRKAADDNYYYTFKGWSPSFKNITKNLTVKPVFDKHKMPTAETTTQATDPTENTPVQNPVVTPTPTEAPTTPNTQASSAQTETPAPTPAPTDPPIVTTQPTDPVEATTTLQNP